MEYYKSLIDEGLKSALSGYTHPSQLYDPIRYLIEGGGKRIRPLLTLLACDTVCGDAAKAVPAGVAVELLHAFTLVHDDIMDNSEMRRGRPTVHKKWNANTAILSGDVMIGIAYRLLETTAQTCSKPLRVFEAFTNGLVNVCEGQALDMWNLSSQKVTVDEYISMIDLKTAKLLEAAVEIGALLGDADNDTIVALKNFAHDLGLAFQLNDDLLDLTGSERFGKIAGGDIVEGKRTWFVIRLRDEAHHGKGKGLVAKFFENNGLSRELVGDVVTLMQEYGIIDEAKAYIERLTQSAHVHLSALPDNAAREHLKQLSMQLMGRRH